MAHQNHTNPYSSGSLYFISDSTSIRLLNYGSNGQTSCLQAGLPSTRRHIYKTQTITSNRDKGLVISGSGPVLPKMVLTFLVGFGAVFGASEGIRASQSKSRKEEHRSRKNNLVVHCCKGSRDSSHLENRRVVLSGDKVSLKFPLFTLLVESVNPAMNHVPVLQPLPLDRQIFLKSHKLTLISSTSILAQNITSPLATLSRVTISHTPTNAILAWSAASLTRRPS